MHIYDQTNEAYKIYIYSSELKAEVSFIPEKKILTYESNNLLTDILKENEYQLRKIFHNKRTDTFYIGFKLKFIFKDNNEVIKFNDFSKIVVYDKRSSSPKIYTIDYYENDFISLYTDGSYSVKKKLCSYVALFKKTNALFDIKFGIKEIKNSSLIELIAVIEGLKDLTDHEKIRIITDSRYVIKGLTEWIYNWKLNDWYTAQGEKVKNIVFWKKYYKLTQGKYIEFEWVKAHSFHFENTICDTYAKELLNKCS